MDNHSGTMAALCPLPHNRHYVATGRNGGVFTQFRYGFRSLREGSPHQNAGEGAAGWAGSRRSADGSARPAAPGHGGDRDRSDMKKPSPWGKAERPSGRGGCGQRPSALLWMPGSASGAARRGRRALRNLRPLSGGRSGSPRLHGWGYGGAEGWDRPIHPIETFFKFF